MKIKQIRKIFEKRYQKFKNESLSEILNTLRYVKETVENERQEIVNNFVNICVVQIQKNWRGHLFRKNHLPTITKVRKAEERIRAFVRGWKARKVMQTKEVFALNKYIKDLIKVQDYFIYVEQMQNPLLFEQLKKDRKRAIEACIDTIKEFQETGNWVKSYIGDKIVENNLTNESTDEGSDKQTPLKDHGKVIGEPNLKELITTERFLSEEEIKRNPYLFESDEFIRQKFLEKRY